MTIRLTNRRLLHPDDMIAVAEVQRAVRELLARALADCSGLDWSTFRVETYLDDAVERWAVEARIDGE